MGAFRADFLSTATFVLVTHVQDCPEIGPACNDVPAPAPYLHHQSITLARHELALERGVAPGFSILAILPFEEMRSTIRYTALDGSPVTPPDSGIHHRNETLAGLADPSIALRFGRSREGLAVSGKLGFQFPVGRTEPNPFTAGREGVAHEHFQFGSGVVEPVLGADLSAHGPLQTQLAASALATIAFVENDRGLLPSSHYDLSVAAAREVRPRWALRAAIDLAHETAEHWNVDQPSSEGNLGRTDLLLSLRVSRDIGRGFSLAAGGSVTAFSRARGEQIRQPGSGFVGISWAPLLGD